MPPRAQLHICFKGDEQRRFLLPENRVVVGRDRQCELRIDNLSISNHHFELTPHASTHTLRDLGSSNGTWLNGERVRVQNLRDGDEIAVGKFTLRYENETARERIEVAGEGQPEPEEAREGSSGDRTYALDASQLERLMEQRRAEKKATAKLGFKTPGAQDRRLTLILILAGGTMLLFLLVLIVGRWLLR